MRKIYLLFLILFTFVAAAVAQSSHDKISYQSVVRDGNNHLLYDTSVTVVVTIKNSGDPAVKYRETHTVMSNANGLISFLIGGGSTPTGNWDAVQWNRAEITMETSVGGTALSTYTLPLSAVPYALYAKNAATSDYADSVDLDVVQHFIETSGYLTDELQVLSISNDTIYLSQGGWVKLPAGFSGDYNDLTNKPDLKPVATSGDYNDLVNKPENLVQDANYVHTDNNYTDAEQTKLEGIQAGAEVNVQSDWEQDDQSADDFIKNKPDLSQYATKNALRDTAGNIRSALVDTASDIRDALVDTAAAIRADMGDAAHDAKITIQKNGQNVGDFTLNQATDDTINILVPTKVTDLEDAGNYVTKAKLNDTLGAYYDTTLTKEAIHDTADVLRGEFPVVNNGQINIAVNRGTVTNSSFTVNQDGEQTVTINIPDEVTVYDGKLTLIKSAGDTTLLFTANQSGNDTLDLSGYYDTTHVKKAINDSLTKSVELTIKSDSLFLKSGSDMDTVKLPAAPTQVQSNWKEANTSSAAYILNKPNIRDSVNKVVKDSLMVGTSAINIAVDTIARNNIHDTATAIRNSLKDTVNHYIGTKTLTIKQGTNTLGTFNANQSDNDVEVNIQVPEAQVQSNWTETNTAAPSYIQNKPNIRDSVNKVVKDSLMVGTSAINIAIDTIARNNIHDTATVIRNSLKDTVNHYIGTKTLTIKQGTNTLGTFNANQSDNDVEVNIQVPEAQVQSNWTETNTAAPSYIQNKPNIRDSVNKVVKDSLMVGTSAINIAIDTIARNNIHDTATVIRNSLKDTVNHYIGTKTLTIKQGTNTLGTFNANQSDNDVEVNIQVPEAQVQSNWTETNTAAPSYIQNKPNIRDSVNKVVKDSLMVGTSAINIAIDTIARNNIHDTAVAIRNSIGDGMLTIQRNGVTVGTSFTANQKTDQTVDIEVPTKLSQLVNDGAVYAKRDSVNVFTNVNNFTSTVTVPSNTTTIPRPTTAAHPCTDNTANAVNVCDLLAVFDSLTKRIDALQEELDALKSATPPTVSVSLSDATYTSMKATATASGNGADITSYKFCISTNSDMSGANCFTSTSNEYTFTGLLANTLYYVTADATNMVGTTTSAVVSKRTAIHAPSGSFTLESIAPTGFKVMISSLDFKEPAAGTVQICYKKNDGSCPSNFADYTTCDEVLNLTSSVTDTTRKFINVDEEAGIEYCVIVKITNGDSTTILDPLTINTGSAISLDIATTNATPNLCGGTVDVTFTATPNPTSIDVDDFENYTWSEGTGTGNSTTVTYSTSGTKTITCTATHKTEGYTITGNSSFDVINTGDGPTFTFCVDSLTVNITSISSGTTNLNWGDNSADESNPSTSSSNNYASDGVYSIVATNSSGCSTTKQAAVGIATLHPCTVTSINANEQGSGTTINTLQDVDGNLYAVVQIGKQCWMKSNLRTTHYSDGTEIANGTGSGADNTTSHTTAYYYRPVASSNFDDSYDFSMYNFKTDGLYYNWKATMHGAASSTTVPSRVQGVCPTGWHVPSVREWDTLFAFVQTLPNATYWDLHPIGYAHAIAGGCEWVPEIDGLPGYYQAPAWNISEFSMVPAGEATNSFRYNVRYEPYASPQEAEFWTSKEADVFANSPRAWTYAFYAGEKSARLGKSYSSQGSSVRCVRDYEEGSPISDPSVTTDNAVDVDRTTATLNGTVINPDNVSITSKGFEWKLSTASSYTTVTVTGDEFTHVLTGLTAGTSYTYRAFVSSESGGTVYGETISFTTITLPTVATNEATSVGETAATLNGTLTNPDNLTVTSKGFEWKLNSEQDYTHQEFVDGDDFIFDLTGLSDGTEYTFKAFMIFENNTEYGAEKTFTTITSPTVTTDEATAVEINTATLKGYINNPDNVTLTSKGFEWKLSAAADYTTETVSGDGLTYDLTGLSEGTTYTFRAFIVYAGGTVYGDEASFTTKVPTPTLTITPDTASGVTVCSGGSTVVTYTASVTFGGNPVDVSSYSWSVPSGKKYTTNGNTCTVIFTSTGTYTVTCTASPVNYASVTNSADVTVSSTSGTVPTFYTCEDDGNLSVTIKSPSDVESYDWGGAGTTSGDDAFLYNSDGVYIVSAINGSCTATKMISVGLATIRPCSVSSAHTNTGDYTSVTGGLETVNSEGKVVSVQDQDGNLYAVVQIGNQCWMRSNLRTTTYSDGTPIPNGTGVGVNNTTSNTSPYYYKPVSNSNTFAYTISLYNEFSYGLYYNWTAAMHGAEANTSGVQGACPKGWHLPSDNDWTAMKNSAVSEGASSGYNTQSSQPAVLLSGGCEWPVPTSSPAYKPGQYTDRSRNCSGLTVVVTGYADTKFNDNNNYKETEFWSSCQASDTNGKYWKITNGSSGFSVGTNKAKSLGYSVRCVRDAE